MKYIISKLLGVVLLSANALCGALLLFCSYQSYINPSNHPTFSFVNLFFPIFLALTILFLLFWLIVYRKNALCSAFFLICCIGPIHTYFPFNFSSNKPDDAIKILSYNTMHFKSEDPKEKGCPKELLHYLKESDADIICLQEFPVKENVKLREINKALKKYPYKSYSHIEGTGIACYSRYRILSEKRVNYKSEGNGSIAYKLKIGNDTILLINNHLESNKLTKDDKRVYKKILKDPSNKKASEDSKMLLRKLADASAIRASQADSIVKMVTESKEAGIIVCGDMNCSPLSYTHRTLNKHLADAFVDSGCGLGISYNQNYFFFRIDHILTNNYFKAVNCTIDKSIKSSDHYPIWCYLKITK